MLAIGAVESVEILAKANLATVIAGTAAARAAYEAVVTCAWMLAPNDSYERERRWMALFLDERAYWKRMSDEALSRKDSQETVDAIQAEVDRVHRLIDRVQPQFDSRGLPPMQRLPTVEDRLDEIGDRTTYVLYKNASQLVHPSIRSLRQVRDLASSHGSTAAEATYRWRTTPRDWTAALLLAIHALRLGLDTAVQKLGAGCELSAEFRQLHDIAIAAARTMVIADVSA